MRLADSVRDSDPYTVAVIRLRMTMASNSSSSVKPLALRLFVRVTAVTDEVEQLDGVRIALVPEDVQEDAADGGDVGVLDVAFPIETRHLRELAVRSAGVRPLLDDLHLGDEAAGEQGRLGEILIVADHLQIAVVQAEQADEGEV